MPKTKVSKSAPTGGSPHYGKSIINRDARGRSVVSLPKPEWFRSHGVNSVPGYVWANGPNKFTFTPDDFAPEHPRLQATVVDSEVQIKSLSRFHENTLTPGVYGVGGEPTDSQALTFAAYLAAVFIQRKAELASMGNAAAREAGEVHWETLQGGFRNPLIYEDGSINPNIGLLILSNVTADSTPHRLEKLRDILLAYSAIPRIVVVAGSDPLTFFAAKLHHTVTHIAFFSGALSRRAVEVV